MALVDQCEKAAAGSCRQEKFAPLMGSCPRQDRMFLDGTGSAAEADTGELTFGG